MFEMKKRMKESINDQRHGLSREISVKIENSNYINNLP
jgi:hypothetical protein